MAKGHIAAAGGLKVGFVSLGCAKNLVDSEAMIGRLVAAGHVLERDPALCDAIVVNTCAFIDEAKQESIDQVLELDRYRREGRLVRLVLTGCLAQRYRDQVGELLPEVDVTVPLAERDGIVAAVEGRAAAAGRTPAEALPLARLTPRHRAWLRISDGCDNRCAFCTIPSIRGPLVSVPMRKLVDRAARLSADGCVELSVIAQDCANYGLDLYGRRRLPELLARLAEVEGIRWIRVLYLHPDHVDEPLLDALAKTPKIVPYLDLPLQHVAPRLLAAMGRRGDAASHLALLSRVRARMPGVTVRSAFIVGFPGETARDLAALRDFLAKARIERAAFFRYSREEGTRAAALPGHVGEETKRLRMNELIRAQNRVVASLHRALRGKEFEALVERADPDTGEVWLRTRREAPEVDGHVVSRMPQGRPLAPGDFTRVAIRGSFKFELYGDILPAEGARP